MRVSEGVEWALHCCTVLATLPPGKALPAHRLAEFHGVPAAYLAKHLQAMSRAGIVESVPGPRGGYRLARPAPEVTLLDVVSAVEGPEPLFRCTEIRQQGPAAVASRHYRGACTINRAMSRADQAWRAALRSQTVQDLVEGLMGSAPQEALRKGAAWLGEVVG